jgi:hypothetical protein
MSESHRRSSEPGAVHNTPAKCIARHESTDFKVLHREPQLRGDPEFAVCAGNNSMALFFNESDAKTYAAWKNKNHPQRDPEMAFDDELGWMHKDSLAIVNELRQENASLKK